jgi:hypothetical protein
MGRALLGRGSTPLGNWIVCFPDVQVAMALCFVYDFFLYFKVLLERLGFPRLTAIP